MRVKIENHVLADVPFEPDNMGPALSPEILILHYTATRFGPATVRSLQHESQKASVHLVVHPDGLITQMVPFNRVAWHAGKSSWGGRRSCSNFSLGIEIVNPGPIKNDRKTLVIEYDQHNGRPYPHMRPWDGDVVEARHADERCPYRFWCPYPDVQMDTVAKLCRLLVDAYGLACVTGHEVVAPGRKIDPGPAFPWAGLVAEGLPIDEACYDPMGGS